MGIEGDGISVVKWAEAVRLMTELLPHVDSDDLDVYQDVMTLITKKLLDVGDSIVKRGGLG